MKAIWKTIASAFDMRDALCFGGLAMVGYGAHAVYPPAGWIVTGAALFWVGTR